MRKGGLPALERDMSLPLNLAGPLAKQKMTKFEGIVEVGGWVDWGLGQGIAEKSEKFW